METEIIVSYAQIISAVATFIVAFVLLYELKQQHKDAERDLILSINQQRLDLISLLSDEKMSEIQYRGNHDFDDLKDQKERTRYYRQFSAEMYLHNISNQYSDLINIDAKRFLKNQLSLFPGMRKMYKESMIRHQLPNDFVNMTDKYIKDIELEVGEKGQIKNLTRSDLK
ncbi:MAG: hypothetical protein P8K05_03780 [Dehalococcoidia bacterium]|nr:hypothetical protein [Dehalococcoidia bacterium]